MSDPFLWPTHDHTCLKLKEFSPHLPTRKRHHWKLQKDIDSDISTLHFQNVLEMQFYDEDPFKQDDLCFVKLFDISNLTLGQQQTKMFIINEKVKPLNWSIDWGNVTLYPLKYKIYLQIWRSVLSLLRQMLSCGLNLRWQRGKKTDTSINKKFQLDDFYKLPLIAALNCLSYKLNVISLYPKFYRLSLAIVSM